MKISYNANFKFELMSKRCFYEKYDIEYLNKGNDYIAYVVGKGKKVNKKVIYENYDLLEDSIELGKYIINANIKDITVINKLLVDKKIIRDDQKNKSEYFAIHNEIIKYITKYGLSINKEDNELNTIISKLYMLYKISKEWKSKIGLVEDMTFKDRTTAKKFNNSLEALSARLNGNMLDNPVKNILSYNEELHALEICFYCTSITSIANQQLMIYIANKNYIYNICSYCKRILISYDKRVKVCENEECRKARKAEYQKEFRRKQKENKK